MLQRLNDFKGTFEGRLLLNWGFLMKTSTKSDSPKFV